MKRYIWFSLIFFITSFCAWGESHICPGALLNPEDRNISLALAATEFRDCVLSGACANNVHYFLEKLAEADYELSGINVLIIAPKRQSTIYAKYPDPKVMHPIQRPQEYMPWLFHVVLEVNGRIVDLNTYSRMPYFYDLPMDQKNMRITRYFNTVFSNLWTSPASLRMKMIPAEIYLRDLEGYGWKSNFDEKFLKNDEYPFVAVPFALAYMKNLMYPLHHVFQLIRAVVPGSENWN